MSLKVGLEWCRFLNKLMKFLYFEYFPLTLDKVCLEALNGEMIGFALRRMFHADLSFYFCWSSINKATSWSRKCLRVQLWGRLSDPEDPNRTAPTSLCQHGLNEIVLSYSDFFYSLKTFYYIILTGANLLYSCHNITLTLVFAHCE